MLKICHTGTVAKLYKFYSTLQHKVLKNVKNSIEIIRNPFCKCASGQKTNHGNGNTTPWHKQQNP